MNDLLAYSTVTSLPTNQKFYPHYLLAAGVTVKSTKYSPEEMWVAAALTKSLIHTSDSCMSCTCIFLPNVLCIIVLSGWWQRKKCQRLLNGHSGPKHVSVMLCSQSALSTVYTLFLAVTVSGDMSLSEFEEDALDILPSDLSSIEEIGDGNYQNNECLQWLTVFCK